MEPFDSSFFNRSVHPLDLSIGPWMLNLGKTMFNATFSTNPIKDVLRGVAITSAVRKLDAVICQHHVDSIGHSLNQIAQELRSWHFTGFSMQFSERELGSAINGNEEIKLTLCCLHLSHVDMKVTIEALPVRAITLYLRQL